MLAVGRNASRLAIATGTRAYQNGGHIVSKPRVRIPFYEKVALGIFMTAVPMIIPLWVSLNLNNWRKGK